LEKLGVPFKETDNKGNEKKEDSLEAVNARYNSRLLELDNNPNQKRRDLYFGRPSKFLRDAGIADADIIIQFDKFVKKYAEYYKNNHPFTVNDIIDLPKAIYNPIAVFKGSEGASKVILTELKKRAIISL
jgi:hypothetical protein